MFPESTLQQKIDELENAQSVENSLKNTPFFDFVKGKITLINGNPKMADELDAVKQWMILLILTPKGVYPIYNGTNFGTSVRKLFGTKQLNNGFEESELEREIREGVVLNPLIERVVSFNLSKSGRTLIISVQVELSKGGLADVMVEIDTYSIR